MTRRLYNYILLICLLPLSGCRSYETAEIVPAPNSIERGNGCFEITEDTRISVENDAQAQVAAMFADLFGTSAGFTPEIVTGGEKGGIELVSDMSLAEEGYRLSVSEDGIRIHASSDAGFFYALQTVRLALPASIDAPEKTSGTRWTVQTMEVEDSPRFSYRGVMLDVARYFMPKDDVLKILDCMSMLKLNKLHLHLTDDNGWRIEIKKYPKLTEVGAWRVDREDLPFPDRRNPSPEEPTPIGGFYTQDDIREIIAYAADRQIEVIPEIDMPAHSNSALAAYPQYACRTVDKFIGVLPGIGGRNADIIYCAGNDSTLEFVKDILDEVMDLFPSKYMHLGGDEAWKTYWKTCPLCQKRIKEERLDDEEALQGWFMAYMNEHVRSKGKTMMGWDEVTNSAIPEDAIVFGWQGFGQAALKAAAQGHRFVMTPARVTYLIRYQGPQWHEPLTYFGNNTLKDIYDYEPVAENWPEEYESLLMGIQGSLWTEFCRKTDDATYLLFPRLAAIAERAWCPKGHSDWEGFLKATDRFNAHLDAKGIVYAKSMYNIQHTVNPSDSTAGGVDVRLECIRPDVTIRYTADGSEPTRRSEEYTGPFTLTEAAVVKCATFFPDGKKAGMTLVLPVERHLSTGCRISDKADADKILTNGVRGSLRQSDFEWCNWGSNGATMTVCLGEPAEISRVAVGCLTNYGMAIHKPGSITVETSADGKDFKVIGSRTFTHEEIFTEGNFIEDIGFPADGITASHVRIILKGAGKCPADHVRPGNESRMCIDEIIVD